MDDDSIYEIVVKGFEVDANDQVVTGIGINYPFYLGLLTGNTKRIEDVIVQKREKGGSLKS